MPGPVMTAFYGALALSVSVSLVQAYMMVRRTYDDSPAGPASIPLGERYARYDAHRYGRALPTVLDDVKPIANDTTPRPIKDDSVKDDAISGLRNLGMTKSAATKLAVQVWDQTPNDITLADMMGRCLRALNK